MRASERPTVPAPANDPLDELREEVEALSQRYPRAWAAAAVADRHAGGTAAFGHLALSLFEDARGAA